MLPHSHAHTAVPGGVGKQALSDQAHGAHGAFVLYFESLFPTGRDFAFPCDGHGQVDLDAMNERIRNNYLYARAMIGRELGWPKVRPLSDVCASAAS